MVGFNWWSRALAVLDPGAAVALIDSFLNAVGAALTIVSLLVEGGKAFWLLLPLALFAAAIFAALAELAVFRVLRTGPFAASATRARATSDPL